MNTPTPVANGIRTDHPVPGLPFVDDSLLDLSDPAAIENLGRGAGKGRWGRTDLYNHLHGAWRAFATDPTNADYAWLVVHHPQNGTSVALYKDDDVVNAYSYRDYDNGGVMPLIVRHGGYWSDGDEWRRPTSVTDPVTNEITWDEPQDAQSITASSVLNDSLFSFFEKTSDHSVYSLGEIASMDNTTLTFTDWASHSLRAWKESRGEGSLALDKCVVKLFSQDLTPATLLDNTSAALAAGVEAATWRAYVSRGTAPAPQEVHKTSAADKGRPFWSAHIVHAWVARRDRELSSREAREHAPTDPKTATVLERISRTLASLGRRVFKADGPEAVRDVLQGEIIGLALRDHTASSMHAAWMVEEYDERFGLPEFVVDQVVSLAWLDSYSAEKAMRAYVLKGVERGYTREKLERALNRPEEAQYMAVVGRAVKPHWQ